MDARYIKALNRDKWIYLALSIFMFILFLRYKNSDIKSTFGIYSFAFIEKLLKIIPAYALIGLFNYYINKNSRFLKYLLTACYPIYVIYMVILTAMGFNVIKFNLSPVFKFFIIVIASYSVCFLIYELLRRSRYIGILFGIQRKKRRRIQRVLKTLPDDLKEQSKESCYTLSSRNPGTKGLLATSSIFSDSSRHVETVILMQHCVTESKK